MSSHEVCAFCAIDNTDGEFTFYCIFCRQIVYCSQQCQQLGFDEHKNKCDIKSSKTFSCNFAPCNCSMWFRNFDLQQESLLQHEREKDTEKESAISNLVGFLSDDTNSLNMVTFEKLLQTSPPPTTTAQSESTIFEPLSSLPIHNYTKAPVNCPSPTQDKKDTNTPDNAVTSLGATSVIRRKHRKRPMKKHQTDCCASSRYACGSTKRFSTPEEENVENCSPSSSSSTESIEMDSRSHFSPKDIRAVAIVRNLTYEINLTTNSTKVPFQHRNHFRRDNQTTQTPDVVRRWMLELVKQIIKDMSTYGVCIIDSLLGPIQGESVLKEVQSMYSTGSFRDGELVGKEKSSEKDQESGSHRESHTIRGDKISWVDGREPCCRNISILMKLVDNMVMGASSFSNNGKFSACSIKERSKAMVSCYPGSGAKYIKHVDNPNNDGRCVTSIYYLNKDWNIKENGGLLTIYPEGWQHQATNIEPIFDRIIFFWSDRRNPHEVQPAYRTRYAITLWYFDENAKKSAIQNSQQQQQSTVVTPSVA